MNFLTPLSTVTLVTDEQRARQATRAANDIEAISLWLSYRKNENSLRTYKKEAERFFLWLTKIKRTTIAELKIEDIFELEQFYTNPPAEWCGECRARNHIGWRPFVAGLTEKGLRQCEAILSALFEFLCDIDYFTSKNIFRLHIKKMGRSGRNQSASVERKIENEEFFFEQIQKPIQKINLKEFRDELIFKTMYLTAGRRSEMAALRFSDLKFNYEQIPSLQIHGKGGKIRRLPIRRELALEILQFKEMKSATNGDKIFGLSHDRIAQIVKKKLLSSLKNPNSAMSCHWLRHTRLTDLANSGCPIHKLKEYARHSSIETTAIYLHASQRDLFEIANM